MDPTLVQLIITLIQLAIKFEPDIVEIGKSVVALITQNGNLTDEQRAELRRHLDTLNIQMDKLENDYLIANPIS